MTNARTLTLVPESDAGRYHRLRFEHDYAREIACVKAAAPITPARVSAIVQALAREGLLVHREYDHEAVAELLEERDTLDVELSERPDTKEFDALENDLRDKEYELERVQREGREALAELDKIERSNNDETDEPKLYSVLFDLRDKLLTILGD
jgi:hypothetical protein